MDHAIHESMTWGQVTEQWDAVMLERDTARMEIERLREEIRIRQESQIPVIPKGAQDKIDRLEAERVKLREALEVGLVCMCESCVERVNLLLLEGDPE